MTDRTCSIDDCERPAYCRGWCTKHYQRWRNHGSTDHPRPPAYGNCVADGCIKPAKTRGWCVTHYSRWLRHGTVDDPQPTRKAACAIEGCGNLPKSRGWCTKHYLRWLRHGSTEHPNPHRTPDGLCAADGCERRAVARGFCQRHGYRIKKFGSLEVPGGSPPYGCKWCRKCKTYRPLGEFYVGKKGPESPCKQCRAARDKAYRKANPPRSRSSQNRKRRARMRLARSEPYTAVEIADRDGWKCQRCGERIGRKIKYPHPRSLTIDHIIPISRGGHDVRANVQAAHFSCNAAKGNRGVDQLRLIG